MTTLIQQQTHRSYDSPSDYPSSVNVDKVVESVTNATKRLSQISTNTTNSSKKRKSQNKIGPWKLGRTLGRGSTGRVRLAKNVTTGKLAAVKIVPKSNFKRLENPKYKHPDIASNKDRLPYGIEREIIIMKLISHPNIMGLYDVWENKNDLYLILEYIEGGELFDYLIKRGRLQEFEAINYFKQIINGIGYLHQFNICHRDLKPENLLLDFNKNIKIADFGMAALEVREKLLETSCGSPHYASPEIVAGKNYHGAPSDIWSCGIILFALLTGHLPFDDENIRKLLLKVQSGRFIIPHDLSWEAKDLITKMLRVNPQDRITIEKILVHPLLTKYPDPQIPNSSLKSNGINKLLNIKPIDSINKIDKEILKNLSVLFHNCDEQTIVGKLLSPNKCPEKMFYYLLMKYRNEHSTQTLSSSNDDGEEAFTSRKTIPRSTSIVKTTTIDPLTGEKQVTIKKIISSNPSSRSLNKSLTPNNTNTNTTTTNNNNNSKVLSNITNTNNSSTGSIKNFKASTSFNKKRTILNNQVISRQIVRNTSSSTLTKSRKSSPYSSSTNLKQIPPKQEPPKLKRKLTGLLDLNEYMDDDDDIVVENNKENVDHNRAESIKSKSKSKSKSVKEEKKPVVNVNDNKSLLNFEMVCEEVFNDPQPSVVKRSSKSKSKSKSQRNSQESDLARRERELAERVRNSNEIRELRLKHEEENRKAKEIDEERRRQSILLQEKQKEALEKLRKHQSNNDFATLNSNPTNARRYVTAPSSIRSSLDPRANSLLRARSLAVSTTTTTTTITTPTSSLQSSRQVLPVINDNTNKVLHKLGIEVVQSPRRFSTDIKTSSSKDLASYLNQAIPSEKELTIQAFNSQEKELSVSSISKFKSESESETNKSPQRKGSVQSTYYKSLLTDINENTNAIINQSNRRKSSFTPKIYEDNNNNDNEIDNDIEMDNDNDNYSRTAGDLTLMSTITRDELPNPRFSRFSFGGFLKGDTAIGIDTLTSSTGTVIRKKRFSDGSSDFQSKSLKTESGNGRLDRYGSINTKVIGLGVTTSSTTSKPNDQSRKVSAISSKYNDSNFVSINVTDSEKDDDDTFNNNITNLQNNAVSIQDFADDEQDFEDDSDTTMLDDSQYSIQPSHDDNDQSRLQVNHNHNHKHNTTISRYSNGSSIKLNKKSTGLDVDLSNFDLISSRTADVGLLNTIQPNIVEHSDLSKETLIVKNSHTSTTTADEDISSMFKSYHQLSYKKANKRIISSSKEEEEEEEDQDQDQDQHHDHDHDTFQGNIERNDILDNSSIVESILEQPTDDKDFEYESTSKASGSPAYKDLEHSRIDTGIFSTKALVSKQQQQPPPPLPQQQANQNDNTSIKKTIVISNANEATERDSTVNPNSNPKRVSLFRRMSLNPKREAPKVPKEAHTTKGFKPNDTPQKSNWFKRIFQSLTSSPRTSNNINTESAISSDKIHIIDSTLTSNELIRIIKTQLELKKIEGSIDKVEIDDEFGFITGIIPSKYAHGRKLKFKIEIIDLINTSSLHIIKVKGTNKGFKNLINIVTFIIKQEEQATNNRKSNAYQFSGYQK
ncbi:uncharacterized protein RJT21DRAFT_34266 [Scheffersomyces amazonensis]|uniref:uncharacterized protein n=1 Tax=Scheffersomyces amazonensis TaxID=1078765 RepID=UPI00315CA61E